LSVADEQFAAALLEAHHPLYGYTWYTTDFTSATPYYLGDYCFTSGAYTFAATSSNSWAASTP